MAEVPRGLGLNATIDNYIAAVGTALRAQTAGDRAAMLDATVEALTLSASFMGHVVSGLSELEKSAGLSPSVPVAAPVPLPPVPADLLTKLDATIAEIHRINTVEAARPSGRIALVTDALREVRGVLATLTAGRVRPPRGKR